MASWVCYTKKVLTSALTSIAGELEQTAQDFNDAFHNLSRPGPSHPESRDLEEHDVGHESPQAFTVPPTPISEQAGLASTLEQLPRKEKRLKFNTATSPGGAGSLACPGSAARFDGWSDVSRGLTTPTTGSVTAINSPHLSIPHRPRVFCPTIPQQHPYQLRHDTATATTRQPEPSGLLPLHSRLSQSSPSLSPLSHEDGSSGTSSDVEDGPDLPQPLQGHCDLPGIKASRPRAVRAGQQRVMPFSVSTPCLIHVHKILPSCKKTFTCATPSSVSSPQNSGVIQQGPSCTAAREPTASTVIPRPVDKSTDRLTFRPPPANVRDSSEAAAKITTVGRARKATSSGLMGDKRPGKVVVVSQPPPSLKVCENSTPQSWVVVGEQHTSLTAKACVKQVDNQDRGAASLAQRLPGDSTTTGVGDDESNASQMYRELGHLVPRVKPPPQPEMRSGSPQGQVVIRTVKSGVQIEREGRQPRWPVLAPLARVLTFAYSQVVNAILLLQDEESSISSGITRSRASSFSRDGESLAISGTHSAPPSPVPSRKASAQLTAVSGDLPAGHTSCHRRQMSQLSLAGSTLSSESFEILDAADMETSRFVYIGDDSAAPDILQEYHLFPSKTSLSSTGPQSSTFFTDINNSSSRRSSSPPSFLPPSFQTVIGPDLMSSSADFAHFDFGELIANRRNNQLNPVRDGSSDASSSGSTSPEKEGVPVQNDEVVCDSDTPDDAMFESFVVLGDDTSGSVFEKELTKSETDKQGAKDGMDKDVDISCKDNDEDNVDRADVSRSASFSIVSDSDSEE